MNKPYVFDPTPDHEPECEQQMRTPVEDHIQVLAYDCTTHIVLTGPYQGWYLSLEAPEDGVSSR